MINFKNKIIYWAITEHPLLISYTDDSELLPKNMIRIAYVIKAHHIKRRVHYITTTTTKNILKQVVSGKIPMLELFQNPLLQIVNQLDSDGSIINQSVINPSNKNEFATYLPTPDFYLGSNIPNRIDVKQALIEMEKTT